MLNLANKLEEIVKEFMGKNVPDETRHDFIIAAIHFNINLNACTKYDLMRIDHKVKELAEVEKKEILTTASIFSYILFRTINNGEIPKENIINVKTSLMNISTIITEYMTYRIDEETLNINLYNELKSLGL